MSLADRAFTCAELNRTGDRFTFEVRSAVMDTISFKGNSAETFSVRLAQMLTNTQHTLELRPTGDGVATIEACEVFKPAKDL